jgi:predicted transposase YdaD
MTKKADIGGKRLISVAPDEWVRLINILPNSQTQIIPDFYEEEFMGIRTYQNYQVVNLWEIEANFVFENNLSTLLPFVPILKGGGKEDIIRTAVIKLRNSQ